MTQKIRVLIVDDFADTRESISKLLYFERDIEVAGSAGDGQQGIQMAKDLRPDVILMDINMPGMDGITATEAICTAIPGCEVIMMSVQGEADYLRRAMLAGAREYLVKPFTGDELATSIRHVYELAADKRTRLAAAMKPAVPEPVAQPESTTSGRIVSVFSPKGGVGRTTISTNVAIALRMLTGKKVALVDCNLTFGDVAITLNLPANTTISDLIPNIRTLDREALERILTTHDSGVRVLAGPPRPELAELITADHLRTVMNLLRSHYDYVVVDTPPSFEDTVLAMLDLSDQILLLTTLEMPAIKNVKLFLEVAEALHYSQNKLTLVVNRVDSSCGIRVEDLEQNIRFKVSATIVSAGQMMTTSVNQGVPVVVSHRDSAVAKNLMDLARKAMTEADAGQAQESGAEPAKVGHETKPGFGLGKLKLPPITSFAARKGTN
ncbi:MAG: response regulator [Chloroflexota bacterium]